MGSRLLALCLIGAVLLPAAPATAAPDTGPAPAADARSIDRTERAGHPGGHPGRVARAASAPSNRTYTERPLDSGDRYYRGWHLRFDATGIVEDPENASRQERTFRVWRMTEDGGLSGVSETFVVGRDGEYVIDSGDLRGRYVIRYQEQPVYVRDGVGYLSSPPDGANVTRANSAWRVESQPLSTTWADQTVYDGQVTYVNLSSERDEFTVAVSAPGLSFSDLERLFEEEDYATDHDARADEDVILLDAGSQVRYRVDARNLEARDYFFDFEVTDTAATHETYLTVQGAPSSNRIASYERFEEAGDLVQVSVECSNCYLMLGGPGEGAFDIVELTDRNGDGRVDLTINARFAGMDMSRASVPSHVDAYTSGPDSVRRLDPNDWVSPPTLDTNYALGEARSRIGLGPGGRSKPLPPGTYDITVSTSKYIEFTDDGSIAIQDETHAQSIVLGEPSLGDVETFVGPGTTPFDPTLGNVMARTAPDDEVALGDELVIRVEASGIWGHVIGERNGQLSAIVNNDDEGLDFRVRHEPTFGASNRIDLSGSNAQFLVDEANDRFYVVIDTSNLKATRPVKPGTTYRIRFAKTGGPLDYPYLPEGVTERTTAELTFVAPNATITSMTRLRDDRAVIVRGTANVASGSLVTVSTSAPDPFAWGSSQGVTVGPDGTWEARLDYSDAPGREYSISVTYQGDRIAHVERFALGDVSTPTPEPTARPSTPTTRTTTAPPGTTVTTSPPPDTPTTAPTSPTATTPTTAPTPGNATPTPGNATPTTTAPPTAATPPGGSTGGFPFAPQVPAIGGLAAVAIVAAFVATLLGAAVLLVLG